MWVSSGVGAWEKICTSAQTISFRMSHHFSKSVKSTTSYKRGTENIYKTRKMKKKIEFRGEKCGFPVGWELRKQFVQKP